MPAGRLTGRLVAAAIGGRMCPTLPEGYRRTVGTWMELPFQLSAPVEDIQAGFAFAWNRTLDPFLTDGGNEPPLQASGSLSSLWFCKQRNRAREVRRRTVLADFFTFEAL